MPTPSQHAFSEKVALITDGASPIGRAVAMQLALYGCYVIVGFSATSDESKRALVELKSLGTLANAVEYDASSVGGAKHLIAEVENSYGRLDLLVNCPRFHCDSEFETTSESDFDGTLNVGLKSPYFITQEAMRLMKPRPKPKIVNVFSACDTAKTEQNIASVAISQSLIGMTKALAMTLDKKFRVNAVAVSEKEKSKSHFSKFDKPDAELFRANTGIDSDDVARTILYLLSSESVGLNGQVLKVG